MDTKKKKQENRPPNLVENLKIVTGTMRPPFLLLTPATMMLGLATAFQETGGNINFFHFFLALLAGVCAHVSVNTLNEFSDFRTGLDSHTCRTPFSGGSGSLQIRPDLAWLSLATGILTSLITAGVGIFFIMKYGLGLLPLLIAGLAVVVAYTPVMTHSPVACLIAPGLGFGTIMVLGTHFILTGHYSFPSLWASFIPFFLVNDLLLLNQFPDVDADKKAGRRHFPLTIGREKSSLIYSWQLGLSYLVIISGVLTGIFPWPAILGLLTLPLAVSAAKGARKYHDNMEMLLPVLKKNVLLNLLTPAFTAVGIMLGVLF